MIKKTVVLGLLVLALIFVTTPLMAETYTNSGTLYGIGEGNDSLALINSITNSALEYYSKVEVNSGNAAPYSGDFPLFITSSDGWYSGTWATDGLWNVSYYTVKAGNYFALYETLQPAFSGTWSTIGLLVGNGQQPEISHLGAVASSVSVPEPATLLLLGLGLVGLAGVRRKFNK